jgi:uroporphyrinogen-III synthase
MAVLPTLIVTRPQAQAIAWVNKLQALGARAIALPLLRIEAAADAGQAIRQAWATLGEQRLVMFVSPNAVTQFFAARPAGAVWPGKAPDALASPLAMLLAGATGPGTVTALREHGVPAQAIAAPRPDAASFDAETLWRDDLARHDWQGAKVLIVRGDGGRDWLADTLTQHGAQVQMVCAYRQLGPAWTANEVAGLQAILADPAGHVWLFSSSQAIAHLAGQVQTLQRDTMPHDPTAGLVRTPLACMGAITTHARIGASAQALGLGRVTTSAPRPAEVFAALQEGWPASIE